MRFWNLNTVRKRIYVIWKILNRGNNTGNFCIELPGFVIPSCLYFYKPILLSGSWCEMYIDHWIFQHTVDEERGDPQTSWETVRISLSLGCDLFITPHSSWVSLVSQQCFCCSTHTHTQEEHVADNTVFLLAGMPYFHSKRLNLYQIFTWLAYSHCLRCLETFVVLLRPVLRLMVCRCNGQESVKVKGRKKMWNRLVCQLFCWVMSHFDQLWSLFNNNNSQTFVLIDRKP